MPEILCAFDLGTNGVKAGLFTPNGHSVAETYREYGVRYPQPQWVEQSIQAMWQAQCEASQALLAEFGIHPQSIAAVGISSQRATFAPLDKNGNPLGAFIGWQDKRSIVQCEEMATTVGARRYYEISGLPLEPTAAVSKILWIKENDPRLFERTATFGAAQNVHLTQLGVENPPCDLADAGYLGLLDIDNLNWSQELLNDLGIPGDKLPPLAYSGQRIGAVSAQAALATGLAAGTPVVLAGGDLQCAGLGMGIVQPGTISLGIGSGGGVLIYLERPMRHPEMALNCQPHVVPGAWELEGICLASGASYKWYRDVLSQHEKETAARRGDDPYELLNAAAAEVRPGAGGLLFMPALAGAGAPNWNPHARGVLLGLSLSTDKQAINRAVLEGICLEIRWMLASAREMGTRIEEVRIWGGAARSPLWNQIAADVYGVSAVTMTIREAGLAGAAICAGVGAGLFRDMYEGVDNFARVEQRFEPNPALQARYNEMFDLYQTTYRALVASGVFKRLGALQ